MSDALIGLISGLIGAVLGALGTVLTLRFNYNQLYADVVSKSRDKWLNETREYVSILLASKWEYICLQDDKQDKIKHDFEYKKARNQVILRLNSGEPLHVLLKEEIIKLDVCEDEQQYRTCEENILAISRPLLKTEWDRVRKEAKGGK